MGMLRGQLAAGSSFVLRDGAGLALCCGGFVPVEQGVAAVWFLVHPQRGTKAMGAVLDAARQSIALTMASGDYSCLRMEVETRAGARIAKMLGAKRAELSTTEQEIWLWQAHSK